jgi:succinoglycan biosynthesis transport protein ExoP
LIAHTKTETAAGESSTIHAYLGVLRRRKWPFLQAVALVPLAALVWSLQQSPLYQASSVVFLSRQNLAATLSGTQDPNAYQQADRFAQTQADLARTPDVASRALSAVGLTDRTPDDLLTQSSVSPEANADLLMFRVTDSKRSAAAKLATAYAAQFTLYRRRLDTSSLQTAAGEVEARIRQLQADGDQPSALFTNLVAKEQQLRTLEALQTSNAFVVRPAQKAEQVRPRPLRNTILGLALGLVLGVALAFLWEALDTRVRSAEEISEQLGLPLLARLPAWQRTKPPRRRRRRGKPEQEQVDEPPTLLAMVSEPHSIQAEAFRMLRTNLEFASMARRPRTIMITSAVEGEGKSTTAANLAVALARGGRRVRLVDLDLRRPILDRLFSLEGRPGITDVALGRLSVERALTKVAIPSPAGAASSGPRANGQRANGYGNGNGNGTGHRRLAGVLEVLCSGPIPPDAGEFVQSPALTDILDRLAGKPRPSAKNGFRLFARPIPVDPGVDIVLIDAPPLLHIGDAMALSAKVDALVVVTRLELVTRAKLKELARVLDAVPAAKLGWVLTGAELGDGYGYGYGYGSGHEGGASTGEKDKAAVEAPAK